VTGNIIVSGSANLSFRNNSSCAVFTWVSSGTLNDGGKIVTCTALSLTNTGKLTLTGTWRVSGNAAIGNNQAGTDVTGMILQKTGSGTLNLVGAGAVTISRLITDAATTTTWTNSVNVVTITNYTAGNWDNCTWKSNLLGTPFHIAAPAGVVVTGLNVTDCDNSAGTTIDASDGTCTDGGGNTGFLWSVPPVPPGPSPTPTPTGPNWMTAKGVRPSKSAVAVGNGIGV